MGYVVYDAKKLKPEEFFAQHPELSEQSDRKLLTDVLFEALANKDVPSRAVLAEKLLDWGADVATIDEERVNVLHVFAARVKDPAREAPLLRRLLEAGADPNLQSGRFGTPLEELMYKPRLDEDDLAPVYDVWFEHPGLDFSMADRNGRDLLDKVRRVRGSSPKLVERVERYIVEHGGVLPPNPYV